MLPAAATYLLQDKDRMQRRAQCRSYPTIMYYIIIYEIEIFQVFATKNLASRGTQNEAHHDYMQSQEVSIQSGKGGRERRIQPKF